MRVLGIDPGSRGFHWCVIDYSAGKYRRVALGSVTTGADTDYRALAERYQLILGLHQPDMVALEAPGQYGRSKFGFSSLFHMCMIMGALLAAQDRIPLYLFPANGKGRQAHGGWRPFLFGFNHTLKLKDGRKWDWDKEVELAYRGGLVEDWPKVSNAHVREAGLIACALIKAQREDGLTLLGAEKDCYRAHLGVEKTSVRKSAEGIARKAAGLKPVRKTRAYPRKTKSRR